MRASRWLSTRSNATVRTVLVQEEQAKQMVDILQPRESNHQNTTTKGPGNKHFFFVLFFNNPNTKIQQSIIITNIFAPSCLRIIMEAGMATETMAKEPKIKLWKV